jgi:copper chaperone
MLENLPPEGALIQPKPSQWDSNFWLKTIMALKLHIPTLSSAEAAKEIEETILTSEPGAKVDIDVENKTVTIEAKASEETFKQLITAAGYEVATS